MAGWWTAPVAAGGGLRTVPGMETVWTELITPHPTQVYRCGHCKQPTDRGHRVNSAACVAALTVALTGAEHDRDRLAAENVALTAEVDRLRWICRTS